MALFNGNGHGEGPGRGLNWLVGLLRALILAFAVGSFSWGWATSIQLGRLEERMEERYNAQAWRMTTIEASQARQEERIRWLERLRNGHQPPMP